MVEIEVDSPSLCAKLAERDGLLRRKIDDNEAIDARGLTILKQSLLAIAQQRIVVTHEHHRRLEASISRLLDHSECRLDGDTVCQGNLYSSMLPMRVSGDRTNRIGSLDSRAIGNWVGKGGAEFEDILTEN